MVRVIYIIAMIAVIALWAKMFLTGLRILLPIDFESLKEDSEERFFSFLALCLCIASIIAIISTIDKLCSII